MIKMESRKQGRSIRRQEQEADSRKDARRSSCRLLAADCFLFRVPPAPASCLLLLAASPRLGVSASPLGRALLVAALLVSAYALVRYWRSLNRRANKVRLSLITLRGLVFVLMSCALAGLQIEYEKVARPRVLLSLAHTAEKNGKQAAGAGGRTDQIALQMISALKRKGFEVVEQNDLRAVDAAGKLDEINRNRVFAAALLLTDGAMGTTTARLEIERANQSAGGAPVYVIADSEQPESATVSLENVTVLGRAVRGVPVLVRCTAHARRMRGGESLLTIADDAKVQASARIAWTTDDERQSVTLTVVPKVAGWIDYTAKVEAANVEDVAQLARPFSLFVGERRWRVLFFESAPTWEAKFIRRALDQSGLFDVDYFAQVSRAAIAGASEEAKDSAEKSAGNDVGKSRETSGSPEAKLHAALQNAARLNAYDCIIVGATENSLLSSAEAMRLREWVERRGGGLIVLGGNNFNGSIAAPGGKLYALLPAEISTRGFASQSEEVSRGRPLEAEKTRGGIFLTPTTEGANALAGYLSASEETGTKTAQLTGQGFQLGALRPGAVRLSVANPPETDGTAEHGAALIVAARYGAGRTLVFAPADSWRLRTTSADTDEEKASGAFNALWQGLLLYAGAGAHEPVEILLSDESPAAESTLTAEISVRDASYAPLKIEKLNARLQPLTEDAGGQAAQVNSQPQEIAFVPDQSESNIWRARFPLHARGRFALQVDYVAGGRSGNVEKQFAVVAAMHEESGAAFDTLRRVARETGGDLVASNEIDALAERLAATSSITETTHDIWELRSWWPLAFIIPLLLSLEWFARRWWKEE